MNKTKNEIEKEYFEWLYDSVCHDRFAENISYKKLLTYLHDISFKWSISKDRNRAIDGIGLRKQFKLYFYRNCENIFDYLTGPCTILEMIIALADRCETDIMSDPNIGDRTSQWFWGMIVNLGLGDMNDDQFNEEHVSKIINRFIDREYESTGKGGLFTIRDSKYDLRKIEIWTQLLWFLDTIT